MAKEEEGEVLAIEGREVRITHPSKPYFSREVKLSKLDLVRYYLSIAPGALAGICDRPIVLKRFVDGAEGQPFYQKRAPAKRPSWLRTVSLSFPSGRTAEEVGSRGIHINVRIEPRWTYPEVRRAALAIARDVERRAPSIATSKWWKEERQGVFLDYNQNAKDRTTCSAYSVRPLPDARVSAPLSWDEVPECDPADFTVMTMPQRFAMLGDLHSGIEVAAGSLDGLLELAARDEAAGLGDAPWPPHFRKMEGEATRVAPSRARGAARKPKTPRAKMPLIVVANSPDRDQALAGLERWKARHPEAAEHLTIEDVLVDSMRGRSSTWTRIRVNLRHVPEELRPSPEAPDPDDDPTREWREKWRAMKAARKPA